MEPTNLNAFPPPGDEDAQLAGFLTHASPPLPDDGFSDRVLARLPAPRRPADFGRSLAILGAALAGLAVAAWPAVAPGDRGPAIAAVVQDRLTLLQNALGQGAHPLPAGGLIIAAIVTGCSLLFALRPRAHSG